MSRVCAIEGCGRPPVGRGWCRTHYTRWYCHGSPTGGGTPKGALEAWILDHSSYDGDACLDWPFHRKRSGVATCTFRGRKMNAARAMCIAAHGAPPTDDLVAAHSCGKAHEGCVNPKHLRWATKAENQADRIDHGTALFGCRNPASKLTDAEVAEIRALGDLATHREIAELYGISRQHAGSLINGVRRPYDAP